METATWKDPHRQTTPSLMVLSVLHQERVELLAKASVLQEVFLKEVYDVRKVWARSE